MNKASQVAILSLLFLTAIASAQSEGHRLLFGDAYNDLTDIEKNEIFEKLEYLVTPDGTRLLSKECGEVSFRTQIVDLNEDDIPEVFVISGNSCTSGYTGSTINLFVKGNDGKYREQLGFPAFDFEILERRNEGFPDLTFGGPGFCQGVWVWDNGGYEYSCSLESEPGACARKLVKTLCSQR